MLFLMGLVGLTAIGATIFIGEDDDDTMVPNESASEDIDAPPEDFTDIGSMIDDEALQGFETNEDNSIDADEQIAGNETQSEPRDPSSEGYVIQTGGEGDDTIEGTRSNEFLIGYGGDDLIDGGAGNDEIEGGDGNDTLSGGADDDRLEGEAGDDHLMGDAGNDTLAGGSGDDLMEGGDGNDSLMAGQGADTVNGGDGDDAVHGYHGDDVLHGGDGEDTLFGSLGNDTLHGLSETGEDDRAVDYLNGGAGDDLIIAGANDIVTAGEGADTVQFGEWNAQGGPAEVLDYEASEDNLVLLYEAGAGEPEVDVEQDAENSELYRVMADGELIAQIHSTTPVTPSNIALVAQNSA